MHRELPLYIFVRNTVILCFVFFVVSALIIEHGRYERGENSLFNLIKIKQNKIRDYNNFDISNSQKADPINFYSNTLANQDSTDQDAPFANFNILLVKNVDQSTFATIKVDL